MLIFITGGVRSGKSTFAEMLAGSTGNGVLNYVATSLETDLEMKRRIKRHQQMRQVQDRNWITYEQPYDTEKVSCCFSKKDTVLLDCLTILLSNELFRENIERSNKEVMKHILHGLSSIKKACGTLIIVSNEVFHEAQDSKGTLVNTYVSLLGKLHQELVKIADEAYLVENGVPIRKKGPGKKGERLL
ncbi:bifunctional adenosylcobinamide kinase/adenosylcobinamide-phosphate guanylyltransferase [Metabacillus sp. RGM 3146]|uniref:bifunctional adenosylcobinamide kinase/adenosylcobinamide-phosphate guanylyltransferase n=1 Tax=Metabacillus sp. RGM 3146 TaxID=3401092 RepID=UPI003B9ACBEE